jgi:hypothetical protein
MRGIFARASYFLASQHVEYKLFFLHGLACLQFFLCGHIDFRVLAAIANGCVLLLAILLWKMFLPGCKDLASRLAWFLPVPWLIFQLQYCEELNFATPGLQHLTGLMFSLSAIYLLVRKERWAFCGASVCLILAISSDGNGLLMVPLGALMLVLGRRHARVAAWIAVSAVCICAYAYRYNVTQSGTYAHRSIFSVMMGFRPDYSIAFIGGAASFPFHFKAGSLLLGSLLCIFFAWMAWRGYLRKNPTVSWCVLFLLLTAIGATGLRSDIGIANLPSRYTIYSALFLTFAWFATVEEFVQFSRAPLLRNNVYLGVMAAAILFSLSMDLIGSNLVGARERDLVKAVSEFEHPTLADPAPSPSPPIAMPLSGGASSAWGQHARMILLQSIKLGIYRPPEF